MVAPDWKIPRDYAPVLFYEGPGTGETAGPGQWKLDQIFPFRFIQLARGISDPGETFRGETDPKNQRRLHDGKSVPPPLFALLDGGTQIIWTDGDHRAYAALLEAIPTIPVALVAVDRDGHPIEGPRRWPEIADLDPWKSIW